MEMTTDAYYRRYVDERYRVLRRALAVARSRPDWGLRLDQTAAIRQEIRALVRVRWFVRRHLIADRQRRDAMLSIPYHDWQSLPEAIDALRAPTALTELELMAGYGVPR